MEDLDHMTGPAPADVEKVTLAFRNRTLDGLATLITHLYGGRCSRKEAGCLCCAAWSLFDVMDNLTDSILLEEPIDAQMTADRPAQPTERVLEPNPDIVGTDLEGRN